MAEVFTESELTTLADELFNLETLVEKARLEPVEHKQQMELDVQPMVKRDDAAYQSMMDALRVSQQFKRKRGERGGTSLHNQVRDDLQKAWVVIGGWRFIVACVASKDKELRAWGLRMLEKPATNAGVLAAVRSSTPDSGQDGNYQAFMMALTNEPDEHQAMVDRVARVLEGQAGDD